MHHPGCSISFFQLHQTLPVVLAVTWLQMSTGCSRSPSLYNTTQHWSQLFLYQPPSHLYSSAPGSSVIRRGLPLLLNKQGYYLICTALPLDSNQTAVPVFVSHPVQHSKQAVPFFHSFSVSHLLSLSPPLLLLTPTNMRFLPLSLSFRNRIEWAIILFTAPLRDDRAAGCSCLTSSLCCWG